MLTLLALDKNYYKDIQWIFQLQYSNKAGLDAVIQLRSSCLISETVNNIRYTIYYILDSMYNIPKLMYVIPRPML